MEPKLRDYIEHLFSNAPHTKQAYELKEEIIRNTIERYHDLVNEGKAESEAYNLALAGIGDINELLEALGANSVDEINCTEEQLAKIKTRNTLFNSISVALYIMCVTPCILFDTIGCPQFGASLTFLMISVATGLLIYKRNTQSLILENNPNIIRNTKIRSIMKSAAIGLYISCPVPAIFFDMISNVFYLGSGIGALGVFFFIAAATALLILSKNFDTYVKADDTMVENFKEFNSRKKQSSLVYKIIVAILWVTISITYIFITAIGMKTVSIAVGGISWIIFIVGIALQQLIKAIFDYVEASK